MGQLKDREMVRLTSCHGLSGRPRPSQTEQRASLIDVLVIRAGSSLRFSFTGPLLFLIPGPETFNTAYPTIGWTVAGSSKTYTATARPKSAIRLWPPEGAPHTVPVLPNLSGENDDDLPALRQSQNGDASVPATPSRPRTASKDDATDPSIPRIVEISLIDWGSVFQVGSLQLIAGYEITPAFPSGIANLPSIVFVGDSITSGFVSSPEYSSGDDGYCGFLDAYPSHLRNLLAPGVRISAVAFPGIKLVDSEFVEGMETKWFKSGPLDRGDGSDDWEFGDRDGEAGPTHIIVSLGTNDIVDSKKFVQTYENFLDLLREMHGRRTGDILVLPPFGEREHDPDAQPNTGPAAFDQPRHDEIKEMVERLSEKWLAQSDDPLSTGDFPITPIFELTKLQLEENANSGLSGSTSTGSLSSKIAMAMASQPNTPLQAGFSPHASVAASSGLPGSASVRSLASAAAGRPSLVVRPSSIAAITLAAKGTRARLHFVDTKGWLDAQEDTFDDCHPTRGGATKIAKRLRDWLGENGFLAEE